MQKDAMPKPTKAPASAKKNKASRTKVSTELGKFWEEPPTLHDIFDGYSYSQKVRLAAYDYEHGSAALLSKLILEETISPELATYLVRIVRGEVRRAKGRPHGSTQHDALTRSRMYAKIVRWKASGKSLQWAYAMIAKLANVEPRLIRQYYEEFKNPPPMKRIRTPSPKK
jgi:hypothetical protein